MQVRSKDEIREWLVGLPNKLTIARLAAVPIILILFPIDHIATKVLCAMVFLAAALTDYLDGYIARKYTLETEFGALLDPIADKVLTVCGLVMLVAEQRLGGFYGGFVAILICRDIVVSGLRLIALEKGHKIRVSHLGKAKTSALAAAIFCLMINQPIFEIPFRLLGMLSFWAALGLSLYSGYLYWQEFGKATNISNSNKDDD